MNRTSRYFFTSESVSKGHPDKLAIKYRIIILDCYLNEEPEVHAGIETLVTTNKVIIAGEIRGPKSIKKTLEEKIRMLIKISATVKKDFILNA